MRERLSERDVIALLARGLAGQGGARGVELAIGDDAALLRARAGVSLVWTVDVAVEGVHFRRDWLSLGDASRRAMTAAASDLAAMGARPLAALSSLILPVGTSRQEVRALGRGQARAARELGCPVVGGNVARGTELSLTTTVLGEAARPLTRAGARAGDALWLVGDVGLARAGLEWLRRSGPSRRTPTGVQTCLRAWRRPVALVESGMGLGKVAHAAIDVSDGLAGDAEHLAEASKVRVVIHEGRLRSVLRRALRLVCDRLEEDPLDVALQGGEDYALLATGPSGKPPRGCRIIGWVERGTGVFLETPAGRRRITDLGFDHLA